MLLFGEKLNVSKTLGIIISVFGVIVVITHGKLTNRKPDKLKAAKNNRSL